FEEVHERGDRPIMKVRPPEPDAVERRRYVSVGAAEPEEFPSPPVAECVVGIGGICGPRLQTLPVGSYFFDRDHRPGTASAEAVTRGALTTKHGRPPGGLRGVDRKRELGRP